MSLNSLHSTDDHILNLLVSNGELIGNYVSSYPGKSGADFSSKWLEEWFTTRAKYYLRNPSQNQAVSFEIDPLVSSILGNQITVVKKPSTITSILPHYFRGFRNPANPINLTGKLVVIDGRNSSGKTSLAESFEWLLSGQLIRRSLGDMGDSKELENCISNQLRPGNETTWVEAEFLFTNGEKIKIKRVLTKDYDEKKNSKAESQLYSNDSVLSRKDEEQLLDELLAGNPPVLMQHSLRTFVSNTPSQRRTYFERLLRLDELANLVEKSVVGDAKIPGFVSQTGSVAWKEWEELKNFSDVAKVKILRKGETPSSQDPQQNLVTALQEYSRVAFEIDNADLTLDETRRMIEEIQRQSREQSFPLLDDLRPQKTVDLQLVNSFSTSKAQQFWNEIKPIALAFENTEVAANKIGEAQLAVANAMESFSKAGINIDPTISQTCPLCEYSEYPTLTPTRISEINTWQPIQKAKQEVQINLDKKLKEISVWVNELVSAKNGLIPILPSKRTWEEAIKDKTAQISETATSCKSVLNDCRKQTDMFDDISKAILDLLNQNGSSETIKLLKIELDKLQVLCPIVVDKSQEYLDIFRALESVIGKQSREDPNYNLREIWLSLSQKKDELLSDFAWEKAKSNAQKELENLRGVLILLRERLIEARRIDFSNGMTTIWNKLRSDKYSIFKRLYIPPAKGKGLPIEIEVKAELDDGTQKKEVDALKVFSESQINILGIAAFVTRSKLLGHKMIILDDPVQSMDEDHFKTFCTELLPELLIADGQVVILTHNDTFAREISYAFVGLEDEDYVTMDVRHSKKEGCVIDEGSRRVAERLKNAEKLSEDGKMQDAWLSIRRAIERLYTVTYIKYGSANFKPLSWLDQTAEYMWDDKQGGGVGSIVEKYAPGMGKRLKEILNMTVSGAHDKSAKGKTDIDNAIKDLRSLLSTLKVGG